MAEHGGYREPRNPAPVSGPGALSQRTDGGVPRMTGGGEYGETADLAALQSGADMGAQRPRPIPLTADSRRPDEPVTAGAPVGEGIGPTAAGIDMRSVDEQDAAALRAELPLLEYLANRDGATPSSRALIRRLKGNL